MNLTVKDSTGATQSLKGTGAGTDDDPFIGEHFIAALGAKTDAASSATAASDATAESETTLLKGIKNALLLPTTLTVYNVTLTLANTEYSQAMPANCKGWEFQCQSGVVCRYSNVTGKVATPTAPYMTLQAGSAVNSPRMNQGASPSTLYFASPTAGVVIEITAWS